MKIKQMSILILFVCLFGVLSLISGLRKYDVFASDRSISLRFDPKKTTLFVGESHKLELVNQADQILGKNIKRKWSTSDAKIASVSKHGKVKGKRVGKARIQVKVNGKTFFLDFTIRKRPDSVPKTEEEMVIQKKIKELNLKKKFKELTPWGNDKSYFCEANSTEGFGCAALAFQISDLLFGTSAPFYQMEDFSNIKEEIRIGDIIRIDGDSHSVIVIDRDAEGVTVVEGNFTLYDKKDIIHWGERFRYEELKEIGTYYQTRYSR